MRYRGPIFNEDVHVRNAYANVYHTSPLAYSIGWPFNKRDSADASSHRRERRPIYRINVKVKDHVRKETVSELPSRR